MSLLFLLDFHPLVSNDLDPVQSRFLLTTLDGMGEEGHGDAKKLQGYLDNLTSSSMPQGPRGSIITNYFTDIFGDKTEPGGATASDFWRDCWKPS